MPVKNILVFCGSSDGNDPQYLLAARMLGMCIAEQGWGLVYGGGILGCMGVLARAVRENGGYVTGVIPNFIASIEGRFEADEIRNVGSLEERKSVMLELADIAFVLPGGNGTLEEAANAGTLFQLGQKMAKPIIFINVLGYWDEIKIWYEKAKGSGFINPRIPFDPVFVESVEDAIAEARKLLGSPTIVHLRTAS